MLDNSVKLKLPDIKGGENYLTILNKKTVEELIVDNLILPKHVYGNKFNGCKIPIGTDAYKPNGEMATFEKMAKTVKALKGLRVIRADVDNLGVAFINGFKDAAKQGYNCLLLTSVVV